MILRWAVSVLLTVGLSATACGAPDSAAPLAVEGSIALPDTRGRIDHLDVDLKRQRLFVAELGNGTVDIVDLRSRRTMHRITGLDAPQGVTYSSTFDRLVVACGNGEVRIYDGSDYAERGSVKLDDDADNTRLDPRTGNVLVGHGAGGIAIIDPAQPAIVDIALSAHPEGFQIIGSRAYVNVPDAGQIDVVELRKGAVIAKWTSASLSSNFPMAVDAARHVAAVFRGEDRLALFDPASGGLLTSIQTCGDADDLFFDTRRKRFYVICGSGSVDVISAAGTALKRIGRVASSWGARTSLFVPEFDRLFVAERAGLLGSTAAVAIFRPMEAHK